MIAYLDNSVSLAQCYVNHDYSELREKILRGETPECHKISCAGKIFGYDISKNNPLTQLYQFPCYVVKFVFSDVNTLHDQTQEDIMRALCTDLLDDMCAVPGYYNLRIPAHIVDLIKVVNQVFSNIFFCGGTVEQVHIGDVKKIEPKDGMKLFFAENDYIEKNKQTLETVALESFRRYQGQYHISTVTENKAGEIYQRWIASYFKKYTEHSVLIAEYKECIAGYCTINECETAVDAVLSSVNESFRKLGTYRAMIATLIAYAKSKNKLFVTSTQFDNYIVQGTWSSLGLRPFYSIYNWHFDNRSPLPPA